MPTYDPSDDTYYRRTRYVYDGDGVRDFRGDAVLAVLAINETDASAIDAYARSRRRHALRDVRECAKIFALPASDVGKHGS